MGSPPEIIQVNNNICEKNWKDEKFWLVKKKELTLGGQFKRGEEMDFYFLIVVYPRIQRLTLFFP